MGLGIVVRILNLMDSDLTIESDLGAGSEFSFTLKLPVIGLIPSSINEKPVGEANTAGMRMLYVEDMLPNQMVMKAMCKPWELELTIVDSGQKAIDKVESEEFDLILMDIQMPGMDGIETLQRMREKLKTLPSVHAFTAHGGNEDQDKYLQLGFDGVLTKPITPAQLEQLPWRS